MTFLLTKWPRSVRPLPAETDVLPIHWCLPNCSLLFWFLWLTFSCKTLSQGEEIPYAIHYCYVELAPPPWWCLQNAAPVFLRLLSSLLFIPPPHSPVFLQSYPTAGRKSTTRSTARTMSSKLYRFDDTCSFQALSLLCKLLLFSHVFFPLHKCTKYTWMHLTRGCGSTSAYYTA